MTQYNHWNCDTTITESTKAFTYTVWFPNLGFRYIGVKSISKNWQTYKSSSKHVNNLLHKGHTAVFNIIQLFDDASIAWNEEALAQYAYDVVNRTEYLNKQIGGINNTGKKCSAYTLAKMRASKQGENHPKFGKPVSAETKAKLSAAGKGRKLSDKSIAQGAQKRIGRKHTEESKAKMRGRKLTAEHKAKIQENKSAIFKGYWVTPKGTFLSALAASKVHCCHQSTIYKRCKDTSSPFSDYAFFAKL